ncbi:helix-turn-helix transcriptional regulator [Hydrogenophaga sp. D2P1]|uniref:Helix-turn-helix transcriptional regulator n=1 Tax=Hydrogenophaga aromaticivorans TaxID=2610898 RepID=A0A7Y8GXB0_9BURK|nr:helix-turn-helix transcriptional regulator [Hydrogenophaga aromaticivorans]NWF45738.1 helix-turn-helix transcriptional regulator [Hydrogenophaga aromaticivorans]
MHAPTALAAPPTRRTSVGDHLRHWRQLRRLSQLDLAAEAELSTRHLSCVETGKASPSRELVLRLCERLAVPLRERNAWLVAAGYAPMYREHAMDDPSMLAARRAVQHILDSHQPWPAVAFDRHWNLVMANRMVAPLLAGVAPELLQGPVNLLRISLHPGGLAPRIANLNQWREHLFARLRQQIHQTGDEGLADLLTELMAYPAQPADAAQLLDGEHPGVLMPFLFQTPGGTLHLISTTTVFGSPVDITLQELALETFFPGDEATADALRAMAAGLGN